MRYGDFYRMLADAQPRILLASPDPALLHAVEAILLSGGARVVVEQSADAALSVMLSGDGPTLALLDVNLPGMPFDQLLAAARADVAECRFPIVAIADSACDRWMSRIRDGVIDDIVAPQAEPAWWLLRVELALRGFARNRELETLREGALVDAQFDPLTGVYNRQSVLSALFRETDRAQRMRTSLAAILLDIDDFGHWNGRLGAVVCDRLLVEVAGRLRRLLRTYDMIGRMGNDEFLAALPGCSLVSGVQLAERIRDEVFGEPFRVPGTVIRLSACFAVASSNGRSPVVVLRELEAALRLARTAGPETIQSTAQCLEAMAPPIAFLSPTTGDDLLAW